MLYDCLSQFDLAPESLPGSIYSVNGEASRNGILDKCHSKCTPLDCLLRGVTAWWISKFHRAVFPPFRILEGLAI